MPKGADNPALVLEAARRLFLERGYTATSMDAVARTAGVSKATVYALFGSKDELFVAMVEREGGEQVTALRPPPDGEVAAVAPVAEVLHQFGRDAAALLLSEHVVAIYRIVTSEAGRAPSVGRLFYANGPQRLIEGLAAYLDEAMRRGVLRSAPPRLAAAQFLAIIVGDLQLRALMALPRGASSAERREVVASGVEVFLAGYAPRAP